VMREVGRMRVSMIMGCIMGGVRGRNVCGCV
jgi:hypothetical protein